MAQAQQISTKRTAISKSNAQVVLVVAIASFVTVFCLVAAKTVLSQNSYQSRVIKAKTTAHKQLVINIAAAGSLVSSYDTFVSPSTNIIGGNTTGTGDKDGDSGKIILDALPSSYDFPALASSLEKILTSQNLKVSSISGIDDQVNQGANRSLCRSRFQSVAPAMLQFNSSLPHCSHQLGQSRSILCHYRGPPTVCKQRLPHTPTTSQPKTLKSRNRW
jgi:hypothetical protein